MSDMQLMDLICGMLRDLGVNHILYPNENIISVFKDALPDKVLTLTNIQGQNIGKPSWITTYRGDYKLSNFIASYDMHSTDHFEVMRSMILQAVGRPNGVRLDVQDGDVMVVSHHLECHIIARPGTDEDKDLIQDLMVRHGWWGSTITTDDHNEEKAGDYIITTRQADSSYPDMCNRLRVMLGILSQLSIKVTRYKIEAVVLDSHRNDEFYRLTKT